MKIDVTWVALGIIAALTALAIFFINLHSIELPKQRAKNQYWEHEAKYATENASLICPPSKYGKPIPPNICKRQDHYREDRQHQIRDHKAQVDMRNAAYGGVIVALGGLILLWWTLSATQKAARTAANAVRQAQDSDRAYITIEKAELTEDDVFNAGNLVIKINLLNIGRTPCAKIMHNAVFREGLLPDGQTIRGSGGGRLQRAGDGSFICFFPVAYTFDYPVALLSVELFFGIFYLDIYGNWFETSGSIRVQDGEARVFESIFCERIEGDPAARRLEWTKQTRKYANPNQT